MKIIGTCGEVDGFGFMPYVTAEIIPKIEPDNFALIFIILPCLWMPIFNHLIISAIIHK